MPLDLPQDLAKGDLVRTANTPTDYHELRWQGFVPQDGPAVAEKSYDELTPAQKAARTRAENKAKEDEKTSSEGPTDTAGDATGDES